MEKDKPRLARLTTILTQLQSGRVFSARDIAEKHQISIRTVYRDIRTLEKSGIPIVIEEGKGYTIAEGYKLPPVMFTESEANALITAEHLILKDRDRSLSDQYVAAVAKIRAVLRHSQKEKTELLSSRMQVRNNEQNEKTSDHLIQLQSAITNYQLLKIDYLSLEDERNEREIEPFALYTTQGNWILIAHCRLRNDFRSFRLDRIQRMQQTGEVFNPHKMTLQEYFEECRKRSLPPDTPLT